MISLVLLCIFTTIGVANEQNHRSMQQVRGAVGSTSISGTNSFRPLYGPAPFDVLQRAAGGDGGIESPDLRAQRPAQQPRESAVDAGVPNADVLDRGDSGAAGHDGSSREADVDAPEPTASVPAPTATVEPTATPRANAPTAPTASAQPSQTVIPVSDIAAAICALPWPCAEALAVVYGPTPPNKDAPYGCAHGESGGDPTVSNGPNIGLFEINYGAHADKVASAAALFDPATNIEVAYEIWRDQGWAPWSCRP